MKKSVARQRVRPVVGKHDWSFNRASTAAGFDAHVRRHLPFYDRATEAAVLVARHFIPHGGQVLDLGAGTGNIGRALAPVLDARGASLIPIESSAEMAHVYDGPGKAEIIVGDVCGVEIPPNDLTVAFLCLSFVRPSYRRALLRELRSKVRPGGALLIFDKCQPPEGYAATIFAHLTLAGKMETGTPAAEIVAKECSLQGVQRPIDPRTLGADAVEWWRHGDFAGFLIQPREALYATGGIIDAPRLRLVGENSERE